MCSGRGHVSIIGLRLCICSHTCPLLYICVGVLFWVHSYFVRICTYYVRVQVYLYVFCVRGHAYGVGRVCMEQMDLRSIDIYPRCLCKCTGILVCVYAAKHLSERLQMAMCLCTCVCLWAAYASFFVFMYRCLRMPVWACAHHTGTFQCLLWLRCILWLLCILWVLCVCTSTGFFLFVWCMQPERYFLYTGTSKYIVYASSIP